MHLNEDIELIFIDLLCGMGGITAGIEAARKNGKKIAKTIACINHDEVAIASHKLAHPDCVHYIEDFKTFDLTALRTIVRTARKMYPLAKVVAIGGLECTDLSKAKGGLARDADSRTLAFHLYRYLDAIPFDGVIIENVEEFMSSGPLRIKPKSIHKDRCELTIIKERKTGKLKYGYEPIPERKGEYFKEWVKGVKKYGFEYSHQILNAADYGAHTSRRRYFGIFAKPPIDIVFPKKTHDKKGAGLPKWRPVKEVLDLSVQGKSIFGRKKPLVEATLERIYNGLVKFGVTDDHAFLSYYYGNGYNSTLDTPCGTVTTKDRMNLIQFLMFPQWGNKCSHSIDKPSPTLPARMDKMCPYLIEAEKFPSEIKILKKDSQFTKLIKQYMIENGISDIKMRGLMIKELMAITGFNVNRLMVGRSDEQKKHIGNAVPVLLAKAVVEGFASGIKAA